MLPPAVKCRCRTWVRHSSQHCTTSTPHALVRPAATHQAEESSAMCARTQQQGRAARLFAKHVIVRRVEGPHCAVVCRHARLTHTHRAELRHACCGATPTYLAWCPRWHACRSVPVLLRAGGGACVPCEVSICYGDISGLHAAMQVWSWSLKQGSLYASFHQELMVNIEGPLRDVQHGAGNAYTEGVATAMLPDGHRLRAPWHEAASF